MNISVDPTRCQGHARCYALAPALFRVDEYGFSSVVGDGSVPVELEEVALLVVANCPEFAVDVTDG